MCKATPTPTPETAKNTPHMNQHTPSISRKAMELSEVTQLGIVRRVIDRTGDSITFEIPDQNVEYRRLMYLIIGQGDDRIILTLDEVEDMITVLKLFVEEI